jgi:hypothetical protein
MTSYSEGMTSRRRTAKRRQDLVYVVRARARICVFLRVSVLFPVLFNCCSIFLCASDDAMRALLSAMTAFHLMILVPPFKVMRT